MKDSFFGGCGCPVPATMQRTAPKCPYEPIFPSVVIETKDGINRLAACFVHVIDINTTFYIDDKHRISTIWAGPVEVNDYDFDANELGLRSQNIYDFKNNKMAYYNAQGEYRLVDLTAPEE